MSLELGRPHRAGPLKAGINHAQSGGKMWFLAERIPGKAAIEREDQESGVTEEIGCF